MDQTLMDLAIERVRQYDGAVPRPLQYVAKDGSLLLREDIAEIGARRALGLPPGRYGTTWGRGTFRALASSTEDLWSTVDYILAEATRLGPIRDEAEWAAFEAEEAARERGNALYHIRKGAGVSARDREILTPEEIDAALGERLDRLEEVARTYSGDTRDWAVAQLVAAGRVTG